MKYSIPFPRCPHKDRPQHCEETSYEYFEYACAECYNLWKAERKLKEIDVVAKAPWNFEFNEYGNWTIFHEVPHQKSGRKDGWFIAIVLNATEFAYLRKVGSDNEVPG